MPDLLSIVWWRKFYSRVGRGFGWGCMLVFGIPLVIGFGWNQYGGHSQSQRSDNNAVIATINGEPVTQSQFEGLVRSAPNRGSGEDHAKAAGQAMYRLIGSAVVRKLAKKYNVRVSDAEIDRKMADERTQRVGKNATDADWESFVSQVHNNMSPAEYRESLTHDSELLGVALMNKYKDMELVTPDDIRQYNQEIKVRLVQIAYGRPPFADPRKSSKPLTEQEAKNKAGDLLARARKGEDLAALAKANSTDFTKDKGGDLGFMPEYRKSPGPMGGGAQEMLAGSYGKEFAEAIHKTATGQFTDVVKTSAFGTTGYAFAKVEARRETPPVKPDPKNPVPPPVTDPKKITEELKQQRAAEKLGNDFKTEFNNAVVVFKPEGAEEKAYYDYAKAQELQSQAEQAKMMAQFGQPVTEKVAAQAEIDAKKALAEAELEEMAKKHPQDGTFALLVARNLKAKLDVALPDQKAALRDRLIMLDMTALKEIEDRNLRFDLADLYREKGDTANAYAVYQKISHLMDLAPGGDTQTLTDEQTARKRLVSAFKAINKPDDAAAEEAKLARIEGKLADARIKAALDQRNSQMPSTAIAPGKSTGGKLTLPSPNSSGRSK